MKTQIEEVLVQNQTNICWSKNVILSLDQGIVNYINIKWWEKKLLQEFLIQEERCAVKRIWQFKYSNIAKNTLVQVNRTRNCSEGIHNRNEKKKSRNS